MIYCKECCTVVFPLICIALALLLPASALSSEAVADVGPCSSYGGEVCGSGEECFYGVLYPSSDSGRCCINGVCMLPGEFAEVGSAMSRQPSMTVTPSGELASVVLEAGIDEYCTDYLNGSLCMADQFCDGGSVEYYLGRHCCMGGCVLLPDAMLADVLYDDAEASPDGMFAQDWEVAERMAEESSGEGEGLRDAPGAPGGLEEGIAGEEGLAVPAGGRTMDRSAVDYVDEAVETVSGRVNWLHVAGIVLGIVLAVLILLAVFRRKAGRDVEGSERAIQREAQGPVDLQQEIDSLVAKGMGYEQVKEYLIRKGRPPIIVSAEIQRNYQSRRARLGR